MTAPERICLLPDDGWSWVEGPKPPYEENAIEYVRADLAAVQPDPNAGAVKVKPLVWEEIAPHHSKAPLPLFGSVRAESWGGDFSVVWSVPGMCDTFTYGKWPTIDDAKAAAQADYAARILAALETTPDPAAIREAALREAAYVAINACLVPPDGGSPTEAERLVCEEAYSRILAMIGENK